MCPASSYISTVGALAARIAGGEAIIDAIGYAQAAAALHVSSAVEERSMIKQAVVRNFRAQLS